MLHLLCWKGGAYCDTYCTVNQVGGFNGLDSCFVTSSNILNCDPLSARRDALSIQGRPDIKAQLYDRCLERKRLGYAPRSMVKEFTQYAEKEFGEPLTSLPQWGTSSYIPFDTAILLQEKTYRDSSKSIRVYDLESNRYEDQLFEPPWPEYIVPVHPMDSYGQRFEKVADGDDFGLFQFLCLTGLVAEVWESIAHSVVDNVTWQGHWLRYASRVLRVKGSRGFCKVFKRKNREKILEMFRELHDDELHVLLKDRNKVALLFSACPEVHVCDFYLPTDEEICDVWKEKNIMIILHPRCPSAQYESELFELRCLLSAEDATDRQTFELNVKHSGKKLWNQHGAGNCMRSTMWEPSAYAWRNATIAVYCRKSKPKARKKIRRYMSIIGGQASVYCDVHKCPLVLNSARKKVGQNWHQGCVCKSTEEGTPPCEGFGMFICPYHCQCGISVCSEHANEAKATCNGQSPDTVLFVSDSGEEYREVTDDDGGAIRGPEDGEDGVINGSFSQGESMDIDVHPENLGPTRAHEIPQDILELDSDEEPEDASSVGSAVSEDSYNGNEMEDDEAITSVLLREEVENQQGSQETDDEDLILAGNDQVENPTTTTGSEPPFINLEMDGLDISNAVSHCILLNMQGHCVTRLRHKFKMNKSQRSFVEKLVARSTSAVVPLVYAEAQLFPSIFWQSLDDGTIPGAVPTALWCNPKTLKKLGIASMREHSKQRITNPSLLTSVDPGYHFQNMDVNVNLSLQGKDTRIIMNRGFADHQGSDGIKFREKSDSAELYGESSENHANVHKLSALVRERAPHFFFTQSCNQESCRGLKVLRDWVTSEEAIFMLQMEFGLDYDMAARFLRESAASYVLRSWNEVADMWMRYIIYSEEEPLGKIDWAWYRKEFQGTRYK